MTKKVVSNTLLFIGILTFVIVFKTFFGESNTLVGVTLIMSILVLMSEDLTRKPGINFIKLLFLNVILGFFSYIANTNIWLGLVLNFVVLGGIGYFLSYNLNKNIIVPFGLQYLFMLYTPVSGIDFYKRIAGLIFSAILIMAIQLIIHRKKKDDNNLNETLEKDDVYKEIKVFGKMVEIHTIRASYAVRVGVVAAIAAFIVGYFELEQGRWIVYTIFSLTEFYSEHCKERSKQRLEGTIIGSLIVVVLFLIINDNSLRALIVLVAGYMDTYTNNYRDKMICVTASVVASVSLVNGTLTTIFERISYVCLGIVLALFINKFVLETTLEQRELTS